MLREQRLCYMRLRKTTIVARHSPSGGARVPPGYGSRTSVVIVKCININYMASDHEMSDTCTH